MSLMDVVLHSNRNPLDVVENMAASHNWTYERTATDEIALAVAGRSANYQISFSWMGDIEALHLTCAFDMTVPAQRLPAVQQLIAMINEQLWIGHFDIWTESGIVMFRHALVLAGGVMATVEQCAAILGAALEACERYFPACQFVIWANKSARQAMDCAMFETSGEA